jgi:uncharacterized protein (TIGR02284 family)
MNNNDMIHILADLIETCRGGQNTFQNAAESVSNNEFRRLFNIFSQQRAQFITELRSEIGRLDEHSHSENKGAAHANNTVPFQVPNTSDSGALRDEATVIAECHREEEAAVNDYQEALKADLPLDVQYVVKRQYMDIKDAYDRIRILQRAA